MTRITGLAIPPSLLAQYNKLLIPLYRYDYAATSVQLRGAVRNPPAVDTRPLTLQRARIAAAWLGDRHAATLSRRARQDFETQRVNEILARNFAAPYWAAATMVSDMTEDATPQCVLDINGVAPAYQDPNRQASWCVYRKIANVYANPAPQTSPPNPSAGWYGDVQSLVFEDRWWAQRRYEFSFPVNIGTNTDTPVWGDLSITHEMSASFRGNRLWASVTIAPLTTPSLPRYGAGFEPARAFLQNTFAYRLPIAPAATPWDQTVTRNLAIDLRWADPEKYYNNATYLVLYIAPIPAHGRYFARNDWVQVWLTTTAAAYYATGP